MTPFKVKPPKRLYRGVNPNTGAGIGQAMLGYGLYSSPSKSFAKMYGKVTEVSPEDYFPHNPLVLRNAAGGAPNALVDWLLIQSGERNMRDFHKKWPDPGTYVRSKGFDGVVCGDEIVKYTTQDTEPKAAFLRKADDTLLYHGTSSDAFQKILGAGGAMRSPSWWGTERVAQYYAEGEAEDSGTEAVILAVPLKSFKANLLKPDGRSVEEPLTYTLESDEESLYEEWEATKGTWRDSLAIYESVIYKGVIVITQQNKVAGLTNKQAADDTKPDAAMEYALDHAKEVFRAKDLQPTHFGDLDIITSHDIVDTDYLVPDHFSGSDVNNEPIRRSNYESFLEEFAGAEGVYPVEGDNGSYGLALQISHLTKPMLKVLTELDEYPSMNDDRAAEKEAEAIMEAMDDWAEYDFTVDLEHAFEDRVEDIDLMTSEQKRHLFNTGKDRVGAHWVIESNGSAYIDVHAVSSAIKNSDF